VETHSQISQQSSFHHYLPVNEEAIRWGAYLTGAGRGQIMAGQPYPPDAHPYMYDLSWRRGRTLPEFQLILLTDGAGEFQSEVHDLFEFEGNVLLLLSPGIWHRYRPNPKTGWSERWISLNGDLVYRLSDLHLLQPERGFLEIGECPDFIERFDSLLDRIHTNPMQNAVLLALQGLSLLGDAVELQHSQASEEVVETTDPCPQTTNDSAVDEAFEIIWTRSHTPISVSTIARRIGITRRTLDRRFASAVGHSVLQEINFCRLSRVKRLLIATDLLVKTVAYLAGFSNSEQLRSVFQASEGCSPSEYRSKYSYRHPPT